MRNYSEADEHLLEHFGYRQELKRTLGFFSSFALSFSVISVTTGLFANYGEGLRMAGPAFIWTWPIVGTGQFVVALVFARLARQIPVSGYAYQWARELAGPRIGWWAGWMMVVQFLFGLPAVCYALANYSLPYLGMLATNGNVQKLTIGILVVIALINHFGVTWASVVNNVSVVTEILGTIVGGLLLLGLALVHRTHSWGFLFSHPHNGSGVDYLGPLAFSSVVSAWTLAGFESAANLAEETRDPVRRIPSAILLSEVSSVILGYLVLVGFTLAMPSLEAVSSQPTPLLFIMGSHLPRAATDAFMLFVFISIFACALANMTTLTRIVWAMARDHQLPSSGWLAVVSDRGVPAHAVWAVTVLSSLFVLWAKVEIVLTGISTLAGYTTYALVVGAVLWGPRQLRRAVRTCAPGNAESNAPWGVDRVERVAEHRIPLHADIVPKALAWAALGWLLLLLAMLGFPHAAWKNSLATLGAAVGGAVCFRFGRRRE
jgi:amino acid transporter